MDGAALTLQKEKKLEIDSDVAPDFKFFSLVVRNLVSISRAEIAHTNGIAKKRELQQLWSDVEDFGKECARFCCERRNFMPAPLKESRQQKLQEFITTHVALYQRPQYRKAIGAAVRVFGSDSERVRGLSPALRGVFFR